MGSTTSTAAVADIDGASTTSAAKSSLRLLRKSSASLITQIESDTASPLGMRFTGASQQPRLPGGASPADGSDVDTDGSPGDQLSMQTAADDTVPMHDTTSLWQSPTIPAPTLLPRESPRDYGLRDLATPEQPGPIKSDGARARRRSSALNIFRDAKTLQSASSFLNGLNPARTNSNRQGVEKPRASMSPVGTTPSEPARFSSSASSTCSPHDSLFQGEHREQNLFKPTGFAYTRPINFSQLHCYTGHTKFFPSGNKAAPVECSVCHVDDCHSHFSCTWCALRICHYCHSNLNDQGLVALQERIQCAQLGGDASGSSTGSSLLLQMTSLATGPPVGSRPR